MAEHRFRRIVELLFFLLIQSVRAAEIGDAAFRRNARAAENDDAAALVDDGLQFLYVVHIVLRETEFVEQIP